MPDEPPELLAYLREQFARVHDRLDELSRWREAADQRLLAIEREIAALRGPRRRYTHAELLAQCDPAAPMTAEDREWVNGGPEGAELT